jgi:hypothetical protein
MLLSKLAHENMPIELAARLDSIENAYFILSHNRKYEVT